MQRVERLRDRAYVGSEAHWDQRCKGSYERQPYAARKLEAMIWRLGLERGFPLVCRAFGPDMLQVEHAYYGQFLDAEDWAILDHLIEELSGIRGLKLVRESHQGDSPSGWWRYDGERLSRIL